MKKISKILVSLIIAFSAPLIFFACAKEPKVLQTPISAGLVNNVICNNNGEYLRTEILLVTPENKNVKSYIFFITDSEDYNSINNYVSILSDKNYIDITNYFNSLKTYHYFVQYIGKDGYINSDYSQLEQFTSPAQQVAAPYAVLTNTKLSWVPSEYATNYEVYEKVLDKNNEVVQETTKIQTVNFNIKEIDLVARLINPYYKYVYSVRALAEGFYTSSNLEDSNEVTYIKEIVLETPQNINHYKDNGRTYLTWNAVEYATEYEICINENTSNTIKSNENKLDITDYLINFAEYNFNIKAINSEYNNIADSNYSQTYIYENTHKLSAPEGLSVSRNGEYIEIDWNEILDSSLSEEENSGITYNIQILHNSETIYLNNNAETTNISLLIVGTNGLFESLTSNKAIIIKIKANNVGNYILESNYTTYNYTISMVED